MRVELANVRKRFDRTEALKGVDLVIPAGRRVALVGPNGSGKSTLIRTLLGLLACDGDVRLDGLSPFADRVRIAQKLAYVPQVAPQVSATVSELVTLVARTRQLDPARIVDLARRLDLDVPSLMGRPFRHLSGGMRQKLLIALAFAAPATLLVLDEPTASLDAAARERFFRLFDEVAPDATLLLCSHRLEEMRHLATHVVEMNDGRVACEGAVEELLSGRGRCSVEVFVPDVSFAPWLQAQGFRAGAAGWWARIVSRAEKVDVVTLVTSHVGERLADVLVRDLESIDVTVSGGIHG